MARKMRVSFADRLGQTVSDMANAASVAATGSEIGVLELAAEDELSPRPVARLVGRPTSGPATHSSALTNTSTAMV